MVKPKDFTKLHADFNAPISQRHDCGQWCAPLNDGQPVCCTVDNAIPIVDKAEWKSLKARTDLWSKYKAPKGDKHAQKIVDELPDTCLAIECKGAALCERDNRSLACRSFPFYPFIDKKGRVIGLGYYWDFEDRCWVLSNLEIVEPEFVTELLHAYEFLFFKDPDEFDVFKGQSTQQRRTFSKLGRDIPLIGRDGELYRIPPYSDEIIPAKPSDFGAHGPYVSDKAYKQAIKELS
ncbi:MAG: hypothetical protein ABF335_07725 [Alphaproteobacteria bacterium]